MPRATLPAKSKSPAVPNSTATSVIAPTPEPKPNAKPKLAAKVKAAAAPQITRQAKPAAVPVSKKPAKTTKPPKAGKLIRDSFTMPAAEHALIDALKQRLLDAGRPAKKSELIRAGFATLAAMATPALVDVVNSLEALKLGRKKK